jgi:hypothetical protein
MYPLQLASYDLNNRAFNNGVIWNEKQTNVGMSTNQPFIVEPSNNNTKENGTKITASKSDKTEKSSKKGMNFILIYSMTNSFLYRFKKLIYNTYIKP